MMPDRISRCRQLIETGDKNLLITAFPWSKTLQGVRYWENVYYSTAPLTESDILLIEGIILEETFTTP
jgi:hypothetical protein